LLSCLVFVAADRLLVIVRSTGAVRCRRCPRRLLILWLVHLLPDAQKPMKSQLCGRVSTPAAAAPRSRTSCHDAGGGSVGCHLRTPSASPEPLHWLKSAVGGGGRPHCRCCCGCCCALNTSSSAGFCMRMIRRSNLVMQSRADVYYVSTCTAACLHVARQLHPVAIASVRAHLLLSNPVPQAEALEGERCRRACCQQLPEQQQRVQPPPLPQNIVEFQPPKAGMFHFSMRKLLARARQDSELIPGTPGCLR